MCEGSNGHTDQYFQTIAPIYKLGSRPDYRGVVGIFPLSPTLAI